MPDNFYDTFGMGRNRIDTLFQNPKKKKVDPFEEGIKDVTGEAERLQGIEDTRGANVESFLQGEFSRSTKPTLSDEDVSRMFTTKADEAARTQLDQESGLRSMLGASGITGGGYAQGLLTGFEGQRWGAVTDARRSLAITQAQTAAEDRYKRFVNSQVLAQSMGREPSLLGLDAKQWATEQRLAKYGVDKSSKAAKKSSDNNLLDGIFGAAGSLLGGLF